MRARSMRRFCSQKRILSSSSSQARNCLTKKPYGEIAPETSSYSLARMKSKSSAVEMCHLWVEKCQPPCAQVHARRLTRCSTHNPVVRSRRMADGSEMRTTVCPREGCGTRLLVLDSPRQARHELSVGGAGQRPMLERQCAGKDCPRPLVPLIARQRFAKAIEELRE
jgi:hypothetical protein